MSKHKAKQQREGKKAGSEQRKRESRRLREAGRKKGENSSVLIQSVTLSSKTTLPAHSTSFLCQEAQEYSTGSESQVFTPEERVFPESMFSVGTRDWVKPSNPLSFSPGPWAESCLGGPSGVGPGHSSLAVSSTRPIKAVPPAPTHCGSSQHCLTSRGQDSQRQHPEFSGLRPSGEWNHPNVKRTLQNRILHRISSRPVPEGQRRALNMRIFDYKGCTPEILAK